MSDLKLPLAAVLFGFPRPMQRAQPLPLSFAWRLLLGGLLLFAHRPACAQFRQAPVEARVPWAPQPVAGSDGQVHAAYELHVTNFYPATGPLRLQQLTVLADGTARVLTRFTGAQLTRLLARPADAADTLGVPLAAGQRAVLFLWLAFPAGRPLPAALRHQLTFAAAGGARPRVDGVRTPLNAAPPVVLGAPLRAGPWLVHEGPGNPRSHHWGSVVAVNGRVTVPQRYAIDFFGLTPAGHAARVARDRLGASAAADWVGFGADVLAVADGVVRDARDGEPDRAPLAPLPEVTELTVRALLGNFVVLEIAPGIFVHYAHLQAGSLAVKAGDRVRRGAALGRLGQSGNANAPHLHLQVSTAATFAESEGLPLVFQAFDHLGTLHIGEALDPAVPVSFGTGRRGPCQKQLPLDSDVVVFK